MANALRLIFRFRSYAPYNLRPHRTSGREKFPKSLRLKLGDRFSQKRVGYTARAPERFCPFLVLETKKFEPLAVGFFPILTPVLVVVVILKDAGRNPSKFLIL